MTHSNSGPDQPEYQGPPLPHSAPPPQVHSHEAHPPGTYPHEVHPHEVHPHEVHPHETYPHGAHPPEVYLTPPPPPAAKGSPVKKIIAGTAALAVLAGGAVAVYAYTMLASSGIQPERVLPATTVAFAKLDLDPAAGQKVAAYRLSAKFPAVSKGAPSMDTEKHALLSSFFGDETDFDYDTEIKPWLGDRVAVAAVPDAGSEAGLDPVLAVAYTDEAKMKAALAKAARTEKDLGYVTTDGYVLISDSQQHAEAVLAGVRRGTLAGLDRYHSDLAALHGDQIAVGWADLAATMAALKAGSGSSASSRLEGLQALNAMSATKGRMIIGAHVNSDYLEVSAISHDQGTGSASWPASKAVKGTLVKLADDETCAALEITGLGESLSAAWTGVSSTLGLREQFEGLIEEAGLELPDDLMALFGTDTTVSVRFPNGTEDPEIAAQVSTPDADRALQLLDSLGASFGLPPEALHSERTDDGYLLSNSESYDPRPSPGTTALGDDPAFKKAVPDSAQAGLLAYVNLGGLLDADQEATAKEKADWKHLGAFGMSVVPTSDGSRMTIRLTTR